MDFFRDIVLSGASQSGGAAPIAGYASWPSLIGAEMMVNGDCSSGTGWTLPAGTAIAAGKMTAVTALAEVMNSGVPDGAFIETATYRFTFTIDTVSLSYAQILVRLSEGTQRSTAGTFSQDIAIDGGEGEGGWRLFLNTATMQLDQFSVVSVGLLGPSTYWSFAGGGEASWDTVTQGILLNAANQSDIATMTGDGLTAFAAAVSLNTAVLFSIYASGYAAGDASVRIHNGSWVALSIGADGWSTPVAVTTGAVAGLEFRGNAGGTTVLTIRGCDVDLA